MAGPLVLTPILLLGYSIGAGMFTRRVLLPEVVTPTERGGALMELLGGSLAMALAVVWPIAWPLHRWYVRRRPTQEPPGVDEPG